MGRRGGIDRGIIGFFTIAQAIDQRPRTPWKRGVKGWLLLAGWSAVAMFLFFILTICTIVGANEIGAAFLYLTLASLVLSILGLWCALASSL